MKAESIRARLQKIEAMTSGARALKPAAFWVGDIAEERRVLDDRDSGRLLWAQAHSIAQMGLEFLEENNLEGAETALWEANDLFILSLISRIEPKDITFLSTSAGKRGRRRKKIPAEK